MPKLKYFLPAIGWWCLSFYLFTLPGSAFPSSTWMDKLPIDKAIHIFLFAIMVALFYRPWWLIGAGLKPLAKWLYAVPLLALAYGIGIEFIQLHFIPNRGFELADIAADAVGCGVGFWWGRRRLLRQAS